MNILFCSSVIVLIIYLVFTTFLTPLSLNKSRSLLNQEEFNSILPTLKTQEFNDTFKGIILFVEKIKNEIQNVFFCKIKETILKI